MADNRRLITWSHIEASTGYRNSIKEYNNKIYSIGLHEFGVTKEGKIYNYNTNVNLFTDNQDGTITFNNSRVPLVLEQDMIDYPSIKWYLQTILFGWTKVQPFLENNTPNAAGRLPQDQYCKELGAIIDVYQNTRTLSTPTYSAEYVAKYSNKPLNITGIELDVEASMTADKVTQGSNVEYIRFLRKVKKEVLIPRGLKMRINAHGMWGDAVPYYYRFHDYKLFAESTIEPTYDANGVIIDEHNANSEAIIDEIQLMTYDYFWRGSSAGASTPIWWFDEVGAWCTECFDPKVNPRAKLTIDDLYFGAAAYGSRWGMFNQDVVKKGSVVTYRNLLDWQNGYYKHYIRTEERPEGWTNKDTGATMGTTRYVYGEQEFIPQSGVQDPESKNEIMYPHVYDMFTPKYAKVKTQNGGAGTAVVGTFNGKEYAATNFRIQIPNWTNVQAIARKPSSTSGSVKTVISAENFTAYGAIEDPQDPYFMHTVKTVDGVDQVFVGYKAYEAVYVPYYNYNEDGSLASAYCAKTQEAGKTDGRINYTLNIPTAGNYRLVALTSFSWYENAKLGGYVNGQQWNVGGDEIKEWYPFFVKGSHWWDCGSFDFAAGDNTLTVHGELCASDTPIYGFVVVESFDANISGGELTLSTNIKPYKKRGGNGLQDITDSKGKILGYVEPEEAAMPSMFALAAKMLRRDARPAILWDDEFRTYGDQVMISGHAATETDLLNEISYYHRAVRDHAKVVQRNSSTLQDLHTKTNGIEDYGCFDYVSKGYSQGIWTQKDDQYGETGVFFSTSESQASSAWGVSSGQIVLDKDWNANIQVEATMRVVNEGSGGAGIRFMADDRGSTGDGYVFRVNFLQTYTFTATVAGQTETVVATGVYELIHEYETYDAGTDTYTQHTEVIARRPIGNLKVGDKFTMKVSMYGGYAHCYVGDTKVFIEDASTLESLKKTKVFEKTSAVNTNNGEITLARTHGAAGIYAYNCDMYAYHLGISTTDRWETMEKFEVIVDGETREFGQIARKPEYEQYDEFGYLMYSGLDEMETREPVPEEPIEPDPDAPERMYEGAVSLDYEISVIDWEAWEGRKDITIKLRDAGVWFGELLIGDKSGMSVIWAGDAWSFLLAMNKAVDQFGAKGIGLWAMGQEDPKIFEMIPDVVPKYN